MTNIREINLQEAAKAYAVANTPLFLLRKLREDASVIEIAKSVPGDEILHDLREAFVNNPAELTDYVRPYVYVVALSMKETVDHLKAALQLKAGMELQNPENWGWFDYLNRVLIETYIPSNRQVIQGRSATIGVANPATEVNVASELIKMSA